MDLPPHWRRRTRSRVARRPRSRCRRAVRRARVAPGQVCRSDAQEGRADSLRAVRQRALEDVGTFSLFRTRRAAWYAARLPSSEVARGSKRAASAAWATVTPSSSSAQHLRRRSVARGVPASLRPAPGRLRSSKKSSMGCHRGRSNPARRRARSTSAWERSANCSGCATRGGPTTTTPDRAAARRPRARRPRRSASTRGDPNPESRRGRGRKGGARSTRNRHRCRHRERRRRWWVRRRGARGSGRRRGAHAARSDDAFGGDLTTRLLWGGLERDPAGPWSQVHLRPRVRVRTADGDLTGTAVATRREAHDDPAGEAEGSGQHHETLPRTAHSCPSGSAVRKLTKGSVPGGDAGGSSV